MIGMPRFAIDILDEVAYAAAPLCPADRESFIRDCLNRLAAEPAPDIRWRAGSSAMC
jgi:hypothetical protein